MAVHSLEQLEEKARDVGHLIGSVCDNMGVGFALLMFDFGEHGNMTWISNAQRADMIKALRELIERLQQPNSR